MEFRYKGYTESGAAVSGRVEAADAAAAARKLREEGVFVRSATPVSAAARPLGASARAALWRELGALLAAGLPADGALALLRRRADGAEAAAVARIEEGVRAGHGFAAAIEGAGTGAGAFECAALASAETGAALPAMLSRLADGLEAREEARAAVRAALAYPCFVLALGVAVALGMALFVVPAMSAKLAESGLEMPRSSLAIVGACRFAAFVLVPAAAAAAALYAAARLRARRDRAFAVALDRALCRAPFARWRATVAADRFASVLGVMASGGVPLADAVPLAAAGTGRPWIEEKALEAAAAIRAGESPADALAKVPQIGAELAQWVQVGEAGGCLPGMLDAASRRLSASASRTLSTRLALLGPALLALVGVFVLALSLALLLPVLKLSVQAGA